jgi:polar amino acid transport system substrate-binding protein
MRIGVAPSLGRVCRHEPRRADVSRAGRRLTIALLSLCVLGCASRVTTPADPQARAALVPTGTLRVGVYPGSPTSMIRDASGEMRGVTIDIGRAMAKRLDVPVETVVFDRVAQVVDALAAGQIDMTITNASPARAQVVDFSPPLLAVELGVLVMPGSRVTSVEALDSDGIRVGVTQGSSSQATLSKRLAHAAVVTAPSMQAAQVMLRSGAVDAFATNKAILFEMGDALSGSRVLEGRWGLEHLAIAVPKGRVAGQAFLAAFADDVRRDGEVEQATRRAGLRGSVPPEAQ